MLSVPFVAHSSPVWRSQAELPVHSHASHCNSLSGLQSYHYHSVNVPQTEHPGLADTKLHLAGYAFQYCLTNIELAGMRLEFLHVCGLVFLQLWLAYLEFLSPLVHGTCIFNHHCCWPRQNFNVSTIVCTSSIAGLGCCFSGCTLHTISTLSRCGLEVQAHVS